MCMLIIHACLWRSCSTLSSPLARKLKNSHKGENWFVAIAPLCGNLPYRHTLYSTIHCITEPINGQSLDVIERAQFVVCLDQSHPHTSQLQSSDSGAIQDYQKSILANRVLHGNGSKQNSSNRWFDTVVQVNKYSFYMCMYNLHVASLQFVPNVHAQYSFTSN